MKKLFTVAIVCFAFIQATAQQDAQFTQYMFNRLSVNPGYAGASDALCGTLIGRQQWMGFDGAPRKFLMSVDMPIYKIKSGVGINIMQDQLGFDKTIIANVNYAYRIPLPIVPGGTLGIGIQAGILNKSLNGAWVAPETNYTLDAAIPNNGVSDLAFDLGFGVYYQAPDLYFGISSTHLPASNLDNISALGGDGFDLTRHYYIMGGYKRNVGGPIDLLPSFLVKTDAASTQVDLTLRAMFNNEFWGGLSYRFADAAALLVGMQRDGIGPGTLKAGLSYDFTLSALRQGGSNGSTEVFVGYCYPLGSTPKPSRYRNPRFM